MLASLAAALAAVAVGFALLVYLVQDRLIFHPQPLSAASRAALAKSLPSGTQEVFVKAKDGTRLHAWHVKGAPGAPVVLYFGGNAEEVSWIARDAAARAPGVAWLLTSYRGYGASEGAPSEAALSADALRWHAYAAQELKAPRIYAFGRSLGSGPAVFLASQAHVAGVILVTPFDSLVAVAQHHYPVLPVRWMLRHRFDSAALAGKIAAPMLCIAALRDEVIPAAHARRLYDAWAGPKRWVALPEAGHNGTDGAPAFWHSIGRFLEESPVS